jgi:hypothetical protein
MEADIMQSKPNTKYVRMEIDFWYDPETDQIHIAAPESDTVKGFHTTVNKKDDSIRCHKNLYEKLAAILRSVDKHP